MTTMTVIQLTPQPPSAGAATVRVVPAPAPSAQPLHGAEWRVRAAGGPEDRAMYACACGCRFVAPVSTCVACPRCGGEQDW